jgi:hypothetical protein
MRVTEGSVSLVLQGGIEMGGMGTSTAWSSRRLSVAGSSASLGHDSEAKVRYELYIKIRTFLM